MSLCLLAYPDIAPSDYDRIQAFRKHNDELYYQVVEPHFTLVFPLSGFELEPFIVEIKKQVQGFRPFDFCIRCSTLDKDAFIDYYHAFLVPDEGYSQFVKLHNRVYAGRLFQYRALEVNFIPHVGIGNSKDPLRCIEMADSWNKAEFAIPGHISVLDIASYENDIIQTILRIPLDG